MLTPHPVPKIAPPPAAGSRPFWSVMIPTYNARADYLEKTLRSILDQDPGPDQMQIEVVDDGSPDGAPVELVKRIAGDRVTIHCEPKNLGLARIWNRCIERAYGEWVHILHQDDTVYPGFYAALQKGTTEGRVGAAFSRSAWMNSEGHPVGDSPLQRESAGMLENWNERIAGEQQIQCAAIVVRRSVYEHLGGFLPQFVFVLDWEMWQRIASHYLFWYEPTVLAAYRMHRASTTSRLETNAVDTREIRMMINQTMGYLSKTQAPLVMGKAREIYARLAIQKSRRLLVAGDLKSSLKQITEAFLLSPSWPVLRQIISFIKLWMRISGAKLKQILQKGI